jgi:heptosyltransferase II
MTKVLIELPTWLGDSVMTSPAIENLIKHFGDVEITLLGSLVSVDVLKNHPKVIDTYVLDEKLINVYKKIRRLGEFDIFFSFRSSFKSKVIKFITFSKSKYQFNKKKYTCFDHQVEKYNSFINDSLNINSEASRLKLNTNPQKKIIKLKKLLGINPGASYGNAKRWYPNKFADVARVLSVDYDIIILGGPSEKKIANDIAKYLEDFGIQNYQNLAGKLSISGLVFEISNLDLMITGDSGPMHIAAAFQVPSVAIFGPTKDKETSQWMNENSVIVKKNYDCQPCMKRLCPLKHNNCMRLIEASEVVEAAKNLNKV